ncbi:hypothetical protein OG883_45750 [Streptomyces sp. NBC_01142]|uniref:hypothetical protein n=1 Tax=Streptomyces sp. NBC_01142 TaxID=2975865 RepID=UPI002250427F|nr:hypothetical protein [Streptomyces sp. NBC_01142]MCX4826945.1 hypothetical protein [Streptomyces sp. NBC_01142]
MTTAYSESSTERIPGRVWTVRLTGFADRSATVTCSTSACRMPARSKDLPALRAFAARHAAAHAKAATLRPNAACHCRADRCAAHEDTRVHCTGAAVLILRHDPTIGRVWSVEEVCETCAPLIPHARTIARAPRPRPAATALKAPAPKVPAPARAGVPGGFSSPSAPADGDAPRRRPRPGPRRGGQTR